MFMVEKVLHLTNVSDEAATSTIKEEEFPTSIKISQKPASLGLIY
jgi:hypothetical protein